MSDFWWGVTVTLVTCMGLMSLCMLRMLYVWYKENPYL